MIGYVEGTISHAFADSCFVNVGGVGYRVFISALTRNRLKLGQQARLFTYLSVREDAMTLYGFLSQEEYDLFMLLTGISGIGPKVALGILSAIEPQAFCKAVGQKQTSVLVKLPGIGKKTAERIIVELHDKLGHFSSDDEEEMSDEHIAVESADEMTEVVQALVGLGYTQAEVLPVVKRLDLSQPIEVLIKQALREFMKG
ncbi:MAG: Holliday junction branch migration protein RuvA [Selenomonadales bacterium]|nr:Holliday junction branch migration protein RuvA [Selenomonadales bacterium]